MSDLVRITRRRVVEYEIQEYALITREEYQEILDNAMTEGSLQGIDLDNYIEVAAWVNEFEEPGDDRVFDVQVEDE